MTTKGPVPSWCPILRSAGRCSRGDANASSHTGDCSSGIGFAWNSFLHCLAVHRAQVLDFFLRQDVWTRKLLQKLADPAPADLEMQPFVDFIADADREFLAHGPIRILYV